MFLVFGEVLTFTLFLMQLLGVGGAIEVRETQRVLESIAFLCNFQVSKTLKDLNNWKESVEAD